MSKPQPPRYFTIKWHAYNRALEQRGLMWILIDPEMQWLADYAGKMGRPAVPVGQGCVQIAAAPICRHGAALLKRAGLDWPVPD